MGRVEEEEGDGAVVGGQWRRKRGAGWRRKRKRGAGAGAGRDLADA